MDQSLVIYILLKIDWVANCPTECVFQILVVKAAFSTKALAELNYDVRGVDLADHGTRLIVPPLA